MILTARQNVIKELYESGISGRKISEKLKLPRSVIYKELDLILYGKEIEKHRQTKPISEHIILETPDRLVESMGKASFTEEQKEFVLRNKFLGRTELSKKLRMKKTIFNHILQKENIMI